MWKIILIVIALLIPHLQPIYAQTPQKTAQKVLDRLYATYGNATFKKPAIAIDPDNKKVAAYAPWKNEITLDLKTFLLCREQGRDSLAALAYIIGHELVHAQQTALKTQRIQTNFLAYNRHYNADIRTEKVADVQGLFNAYLAGYQVLGVMPRIIDAIYEAYGLMNKPLAGYPSIEERRQTAEEVLEIVRRLCDLFESGNYLLAIGQTSLACSGYEYILQYYQGVEIYNNLGVAYTLSAQQFWDPVSDRFVYPLEADWNTKLSRLQSSRGQETLDPSMEPLRLALLEKAIRYFNQALDMQPRYATARINVTCALAMSGKPVEALQYAERHLAKNTNAKKKKQSSEMAEIALGIVYALQPGKSRHFQAEAIFKKMSLSPRALPAMYARYNLESLQGRLPAPSTTELELPESFRQTIARMELGRTSDLPQTTIDASNLIQFGKKQTMSAVTYVFSNAEGNLVSLLLFTNRNAPTAAILPAWEHLTDTAYRNVIPTPSGYYLKSTRDHAVLKVNSAGQVLEMVKFIEH